MKISYDKDADALTIKFKNKSIVKDKQIATEVFAGFSKDGDLVEIQILDISDSDKAWLTVDLVAKILGKSERTILRWIEKGTLPAKKVGKEFHIDPAVLDDLAS
jgi:excisionase family DNA binding protein